MNYDYNQTYNGSIELAGSLKPAGDNNFPIVDSSNVNIHIQNDLVNYNTNLESFLNQKNNVISSINLSIATLNKELKKILKFGGTISVIRDKTGTTASTLVCDLTEEAKTALNTQFPNNYELKSMATGGNSQVIALNGFCFNFLPIIEDTITFSSLSLNSNSWLYSDGTTWKKHDIYESLERTDNKVTSINKNSTYYDYLYPTVNAVKGYAVTQDDLEDYVTNDSLSTNYVTLGGTGQYINGFKGFGSSDYYSSVNSNGLTIHSNTNNETKITSQSIEKNLDSETYKCVLPFAETALETEPSTISSNGNIIATREWVNSKYPTKNAILSSFTMSYLNGKLVITLLDAMGGMIDQHEVNLPKQQMIEGIDYDEGIDTSSNTKHPKLIIKYKESASVSVPLGDFVENVLATQAELSGKENKILLFTSEDDCNQNFWKLHQDDYFFLTKDNDTYDFYRCTNIDTGLLDQQLLFSSDFSSQIENKLIAGNNITITKDSNDKMVITCAIADNSISRAKLDNALKSELGLIFGGMITSYFTDEFNNIALKVSSPSSELRYRLNKSVLNEYSLFAPNSSSAISMTECKNIYFIVDENMELPTQKFSGLTIMRNTCIVSTGTAWKIIGNNGDDFPSLEGYATQTWVENKNYLTSHQDLSNYATQSWVNSQQYLQQANLNAKEESIKAWVENKNYLTSHQDISGKQDKLTPGTNITISDDNVISATGGGSGSSYTKGTGIDITNNVISVDTNKVLTTDTDQTITGKKTFGNNGLNVSEGNNTTIYGTNSIFRNNYNIYFPSQTGTVALTSDIPSLNGYATQTWINEQSFAKTSDIPTNYMPKITRTSGTVGNGHLVTTVSDGTLAYSGMVVSKIENTDNKTVLLSDESTDTQYPSAKAVVDYVSENSGGTPQIIIETFSVTSQDGDNCIGFSLADLNITDLSKVIDIQGKISPFVSNDISNWGLGEFFIYPMLSSEYYVFATLTNMTHSTSNNSGGCFKLDIKDGRINTSNARSYNNSANILSYSPSSSQITGIYCSAYRTTNSTMKAGNVLTVTVRRYA